MRVRVAERLRECASRREGTECPCDTFAIKVSWSFRPLALKAAADIAESIAHCQPPTLAATKAECGPLSWCEECARHDASVIAKQLREDRRALCR